MQALTLHAVGGTGGSPAPVPTPTPTPVAAGAPGQVQGIAYTTTPSSITISWNANSASQRVVYYELMHTDAFGNLAPASDAVAASGGTVANDFDVQGTQITLVNLTPNAPLHFEVRAWNNAGAGPWSPVMVATTGANTIPPPNLTGVVPAPPAQPTVPMGAPIQVQGLVATYGPGGPGTFPVTLTWQPVSNTSYYHVHMLSDAEAIGAPYGLMTDPGFINRVAGWDWNVGANTSCVVTQPGGTMIFEVAACNAAGCGLWSQRTPVQAPPSDYGGNPLQQ